MDAIEEALLEADKDKANGIKGDDDNDVGYNKDNGDNTSGEDPSEDGRGDGNSNNGSD